MPHGVYPSIVDLDRRKVDLSGSDRFLERDEKPIQVSREAHDLLERHVEHHRMPGGRRGSVLTLASVASLS